MVAKTPDTTTWITCDGPLIPKLWSKNALEGRLKDRLRYGSGSCRVLHSLTKSQHKIRPLHSADQMIHLETEKGRRDGQCVATRDEHLIMNSQVLI